jgi:hypothetical protein
MEYRFNEIEQKWQANWKENKVYRVSNDSSKPKYYVLDMFPYPSGAGLHVGHPMGYIASDIGLIIELLKNMPPPALPPFVGIVLPQLPPPPYPSPPVVVPLGGDNPPNPLNIDGAFIKVVGCEVVKKAEAPP